MTLFSTFKCKHALCSRMWRSCTGEGPWKTSSFSMLPLRLTPCMTCMRVGMSERVGRPFQSHGLRSAIIPRFSRSGFDANTGTMVVLLTSTLLSQTCPMRSYVETENGRRTVGRLLSSTFLRWLAFYGHVDDLVVLASYPLRLRRPWNRICHRGQALHRGFTSSERTTVVVLISTLLKRTCRMRLYVEIESGYITVEC
jgi:hypothetical protein